MLHGYRVLHNLSASYVIYRATKACHAEQQKAQAADRNRADVTCSGRALALTQCHRLTVSTHLRAGWYGSISQWYALSTSNCIVIIISIIIIQVAITYHQTQVSLAIIIPHLT